jgi:hypothetical protein
MEVGAFRWIHPTSKKPYEGCRCFVISKVNSELEGAKGPCAKWFKKEEYN